MSTGHCDDFWRDRLHFQRRYRGDLLAQPFMGNVAMYLAPGVVPMLAFSLVMLLSTRT